MFGDGETAMTMDDASAGTIYARVEAVNAGNTAAAVALTTDDVTIHGPRGAASGSQALEDWIQQSDIFLEILRLQANGAQFVAKCAATWPGEEGRTYPVPTVLRFEIRDNLICSIRRSDTIEELPQR
jgi:hypothetical protein